MPEVTEVRPLVPQLPSVGKSMEVCVQKGSPKTVHICANQLCFVTTVFFSAQSDEIRRQKKMCHISGTYIIQDLHTKIARGHPGDRQGWLHHTLLGLSGLFQKKQRLSPYSQPLGLSLLASLKTVQCMSLLPWVPQTRRILSRAHLG